MSVTIKTHLQYNRWYRLEYMIGDTFKWSKYAIVKIHNALYMISNFLNHNDKVYMNMGRVNDLSNSMKRVLNVPIEGAKVLEGETVTDKDLQLAGVPN